MVAMVPFYLEIQTKECSCGGYKSSFHHWSRLEGNSHEYIFIACMNQNDILVVIFCLPVCLSFNENFVNKELTWKLFYEPKWKGKFNC